MTLIDKTAPGQTHTLSFEVDLPHPPPKVWRALTEPALLAEWLLPVVGFNAEPGTAFTFNAPPQPGWDGVVNCRMREIEPLRKLRYAWIVGNIDTVVTFTLRPIGGAAASGTRLSIEQSGFKPDQKAAFGGARYGWNMMGGQLVEILARAD